MKKIESLDPRSGPAGWIVIPDTEARGCPSRFEYIIQAAGNFSAVVGGPGSKVKDEDSTEIPNRKRL
jgi:hypothetical protein